MLNRCEFIGNLGRDPEVRSTQNGSKVCNLSLAVAERWKDKDGNKQEKTEWVSVVIWNQLADIAEQYLHKGSRCYISGKLQTRKWTDKSGADRYSTEVVVQGFDGKLLLLDRRPDSANAERGQGTDDQSRAAGAGHTDLDDEIPFGPCSY